jgi:hypothetical protein
MLSPAVVVIDLDLVRHGAEMVDAAGEDAGSGDNGTTHSAIIDGSSC